MQDSLDRNVDRLAYICLQDTVPGVAPEIIRFGLS